MNYTIFDGLALSDLHFEPDHPIKKISPVFENRGKSSENSAVQFCHHAIFIMNSALFPGSSLTGVKTGSIVEKVPPSQKMTP